MSAEIPAYCEMPALKLVKGQTPARYEPRGGAISKFAPVFVDFDSVTAAPAGVRVKSRHCTGAGFGMAEATFLVTAKAGKLVATVATPPISDAFPVRIL